MAGHEFSVAILVFFLLSGAGLASLLLHRKLPDRYRQDDTAAIIRMVANVFVVVTSLVLGLMVNSAKNTFETADRDVHAIATEIILLDKLLRRFGEVGDEARRDLLGYVKQASAVARTKANGLADSSQRGEDLLDRAGESLRAITPTGGAQMALWEQALTKYQAVFDLRWKLVQQADGTIPSALLAMVVLWLALIFGSFGYRAPANFIVVLSILLAAALMAATIYLIVDMDVPFGGPMSVSHGPIDRVLDALSR